MPNFTIEYPTNNTYSIAYDTPITDSSVVHIIGTKQNQCTKGSRNDLEEFQVPAPDTPPQQETTKNAVKARVNVLFGERPDIDNLLEQVDEL